MTIPFAKFHGFGNDYIVIERKHLSVTTDLSALAIAICNRHTGAGSDGIAVVEPAEDHSSDFFCEIVNPDGSVAGLSGNGTRCAVAYLYHKGSWTHPVLRLATRSGLKTFKLLERPSSAEYWFEAEIGKPGFAANEVPVAGRSGLDHVVNLPVIVSGDQHLISAVNVGNPVACLFVDSFDFDWRTIGRSLEVDPTFPERANIVFVRVRDRENIDVRIWERGVGETSSSGTCSSGAAVLSAFTGRTGRRVAVRTEGGITRVEWRESDDEIILTGRADLSYTGNWPR